MKLSEAGVALCKRSSTGTAACTTNKPGGSEVSWEMTIRRRSIYKISALCFNVAHRLCNHDRCYSPESRCCLIGPPGGDQACTSLAWRQLLAERALRSQAREGKSTRWLQINVVLTAVGVSARQRVAISDLLEAGSATGVALDEGRLA